MSAAAAGESTWIAPHGAPLHAWGAELLRNASQYIAWTAMLCLIPCLACAARRARKPADPYRQGGLCGQVVDVTTGKPIAGATVAMEDASGRVLAWTVTNKDGDYVLPADPLTCLHLRPSKGKGLLQKVCDACGAILMAPVRVAGTAVEVVKQAASPQAIENVAVAAATGDPLPVIGQAEQTALNTLRDVQQNGLTNSKAEAVRSSFASTRATRTKPPKQTLQPGQALIAVEAPNYDMERGPSAEYWMEPPVLTSIGPVGPLAWLQTVKLAPVNGKAKCAMGSECVKLAEGSAVPSLAPAGSSVKVTATLQGPPELLPEIRVYARVNTTRGAAELKPDKAGSATYTGSLPIDPKAATGPATIGIIALRAQPLDLRLKPSKQDPLLLFVQRMSDLDPKRPFEFDPRIMAAQNRLELDLTILGAGQHVPTSTITPAAPGSKPPAGAPTSKP